MRRIATFIAALIVWCLLAYTGNSGDWIHNLTFGIIASLLVAATFSYPLAVHPLHFLNPIRWFWFLVYIPVLIYSVVIANLHVMYIVLHPDLPIRPGVVKVKTRLQSSAARAALANSITLTPGTLVIDITPDGYIYVHWLVVESTEMRAATKAIVERFEGLIEKIME